VKNFVGNSYRQFKFKEITQKRNIMKYVFFVMQTSLYYFKKSIETLYVGLRNPVKFYEEERKQNEMIMKVLPALVATSMFTQRENQK